MMESLNLAKVWKLPVLFVCKNDEWAVTTFSSHVTAGHLIDRARSFDIPAAEVNGNSIEEVWTAVNEAVKPLREGEGPSFLLANCVHLTGHFLGDPLLRITRHPIKEARKMTGPLLRSLSKKKGESIKKRTENLGNILGLIGKTFKTKRLKKNDPLYQTRLMLEADKELLKEMEEKAITEIQQIVKKALETDNLNLGKDYA